MIIFDECKYIEDLLEIKELKRITNQDIFMLSKYLYRNGEINIKQKLISIINNKDKTFNSVKHFDRINKCIIKLNKWIDNGCVDKDNEIIIFNNELDSINKFKDSDDENKNFEYKKVLFVILCIAKFNNADIIGTKSGSLCTIRDIIKLSNSKLKTNEKSLLFYKLQKYGYINMFMPNLSKILYISKSDIDNEPILTFNASQDMILNYEKYCGVRVKNCDMCGRLYRQKSNRQKYCTACAVKINYKKHNDVPITDNSLCQSDLENTHFISDK